MRHLFLVPILPRLVHYSSVGGLRRNATDVAFSLRYNVMPYVGVLTTGEAARSTEIAGFPEALRA